MLFLSELLKTSLVLRWPVGSYLFVPLDWVKCNNVYADCTVCVFLGCLNVLFIAGCWSRSIGSLSPLTNRIDPTLLQSKSLPGNEIAFIDKTEPFVYVSDGTTIPFLQFNFWMSGGSLWCWVYDFGVMHSLIWIHVWFGLYLWSTFWSMVYTTFLRTGCACVYDCVSVIVCPSECVCERGDGIDSITSQAYYYYYSIVLMRWTRESPEWWCHSLR